MTETLQKVYETFFGGIRTSDVESFSLQTCQFHRFGFLNPNFWILDRRFPILEMRDALFPQEHRWVVWWNRFSLRLGPVWAKVPDVRDTGITACLPPASLAASGDGVSRSNSFEVAEHECIRHS